MFYEEYKVSDKLMDEITSIVVPDQVDNAFYWRFAKTTKAPDYGDMFEKKDCIADTPQMVHQLYTNCTPVSDHFWIFLKVFEDIDVEPLAIWRMKINMLFPNNSKIENPYQAPHRDIDMVKGVFKVLLLYVNDSDGDTLFFDEGGEIIGRSKPERGKALLFDASSVIHAGQNPVESQFRIVCNTIFIPKSIEERINGSRISTR